MWVTFSVPWMAWTVAGNGRTEGGGAGEEEGEGWREERESGAKVNFSTVANNPKVPP